MIIRKRGVIMTEYATLIAATISAILLMAVYVRRAIAGRLRSAADSIGDQYAPGEVTSVVTTTNTSGKTVTNSRLLPTFVNGSKVLAMETTTSTATPETTRTEVFEVVGPLGTDLWN